MVTLNQTVASDHDDPYIRQQLKMMDRHLQRGELGKAQRIGKIINFYKIRLEHTE